MDEVYELVAGRRRESTVWTDVRVEARHDFGGLTVVTLLGPGTVREVDIKSAEVVELAALLAGDRAGAVTAVGTLVEDMTVEAVITVVAPGGGEVVVLFDCSAYDEAGHTWVARDQLGATVRRAQRVAEKANGRSGQ